MLSESLLKEFYKGSIQSAAKKCIAIERDEADLFAIRISNGCTEEEARYKCAVDKPHTLWRDYMNYENDKGQAHAYGFLLKYEYDQVERDIAAAVEALESKTNV